MTTTITSPKRFVSNQFLKFAVIASVTLGASLGAANADPITVPNFSFESPAQGDGGFAFEFVDGWTFLDGTGGVFDPVDAQFSGSTGGDLPAPALGQQAVFLGNGLTNNNIITTTSSLTSIVADTKYTLTLAIGNSLNFPADPSGTATLSFLANGVLIPGSSTTITTDTATIPLGTFADFSTSFTTTMSSPQIGQGLTVRVSYFPFLAEGPSQNGQLMIDNVRVDAEIVPEPTSAILLASALPLFLRRRRR